MPFIHQNLSKSAKFTAFFALITEFFLIGYMIVAVLFYDKHYEIGVVPILFAFTYLVGGYFGLKGKRWAFGLLFITFLMQTIKYTSIDFSFNYQNWLSFNIQFYMTEAMFTINLLAIILTITSWIAFKDLKHDSNYQKLQTQKSKQVQNYEFKI